MYFDFSRFNFIERTVKKIFFLVFYNKLTRLLVKQSQSMIVITRPSQKTSKQETQTLFLITF